MENNELRRRRSLRTARKQWEFIMKPENRIFFTQNKTKTISTREF